MKQRPEQFEADLSAYLDNELSPAQRDRVEAVLSRDPAARALLADLQAMRSGLQALPRARASADMMEAIRARMERDALLGPAPAVTRRQTGSFGSATRWAAAASIVLAVSLGGYLLWNSSQPEALRENRELALSNAPDASGGHLADDSATVSATDRAARWQYESADAEESGRLAQSQERREDVGLFGVPFQPPAASPSTPAAAPPPLALTSPHEAADGLTVADRATEQNGVTEQDRERIYLDLTRERGMSAVPGQLLQSDIASDLSDADARVVTVSLADAGSKQWLLDELSARAVLIRQLKSTDGTARSPVARSASPASPAQKARAADPSAPTEETPEYVTALPSAPEQQVATTTGDGEVAPTEPVRARRREQAATDLLVVVPDERARDEMLARLNQSAAATSRDDDVDAAAAEGEPQALPVESQPTVLRANMPAAEMSVLTPPGRPRTAPADIVHIVRRFGAGQIVRLHIRVQEEPTDARRATRQGDKAASSATAPADILPLDPSVLDLGGRRRTEAASQPAASQPR